ncbi:MAG TPA: ABC transporter substrate-binding protein, partial [Candidatus Paceibacterota bacterium]
MDKSTKVIVWIIVLAVIIWGGYSIANRGGSNVENKTAGGQVDSGTGPIKLGVIQGLTGDIASIGMGEVRAIQVALAEINKNGGINGRQLEIVTEDGKCDPQAGGTAAQKLVSIDKVMVIIGGTCSGETLAAATITEPAKVILISSSATSPKITTAG